MNLLFFCRGFLSPHGLDSPMVCFVVAHFCALFAGFATFLSSHFFDSLSFYGTLSIFNGIENIADFATSKESVELPRSVYLAFNTDTAGGMT